jgi:predicted DNA-binding protein
VTFRLDDREHDALLSLSKIAGLGPSAFARRIVEAYIEEHAGTYTKKTPRNRGRGQ